MLRVGVLVAISERWALGTYVAVLSRDWLWALRTIPKWESLRRFGAQ